MHREKSNKRTNQKVQLKNSGCKERTNRTKKRKTKRRKKQLGSSKLKLGQILPGQNLFKLIRWNGCFETKLQALESPDSDKRAKSYTRTKIGSEIAIRNNGGKSEKKKTTNRLTNERSFSATKR